VLVNPTEETPIILTTHAKKRLKISLTTEEEVKAYLRQNLTDVRLGKIVKVFDGFRRYAVKRDKVGDTDGWVVLTVHPFSPRKSRRI
jgi:hypothetical protein